MDWENIPLKPPSPPHSHIRYIPRKTVKDRLYPGPPPFSAREHFQKIEEERKKPIVSTLKGAPRFTGNFTINGVERKKVIKNEPSREKVDEYLELLRKSRPKAVKQYTPRSLLRSQVPFKLVNPHTEKAAEPSPREITRIFDRSPRFKVRNTNLACNLPDNELTREFKEYIVKSGERIPSVLNSVCI